MRDLRKFLVCSVLCSADTWPQEDTANPIATICGFQTFRADRNKSESRKKRGGRIAAFINNRWCNTGHITVKEHFGSPDIELLAVGHTSSQSCCC